MNKSAIALLMAGATQAASSNDTKLEAIVEGILMGALDAEGFTDITHCIQDGETLFTDAELAYKDFNAGGAENVIKGIEEIADMLKVVEAGMSDCSQLKEDWAKLSAMAAIFANPTSFAYHVGKDLLLNGKDIYHEINTAIGDYKEQNWEQFGYNVGEAAAKVILGEESQSKIELAKVMQGVIQPFGGHFNLDALLACVKDEATAVLILDEAYNMFKAAYEDKDVKEVIGGVLATVAGLKDAQAGLGACVQVDPSSWDYAALMKSESLMTDPIANFKVIGDDLLINGVSIIADAEKAMLAYQNGDFETFGVNMGSIFKLVTEEPATGLTPVRQRMDKKDVTSVAQGFLSATNVADFNFQALLICIYEADQAAEVLYEAVEIFEEAYADKDVMEAIGGVIATVAFVQGVEQTIPVCESVDKTKMSWGTFHHIVETIENPLTSVEVVGKNVVLNGNVITKDLGSALDAWNSGDMYRFGSELGSVLVEATF